MTIDLRYVIPVAAFFAPAPMMKIMDILWGSNLPSGVWIFYAIIMGVFAALFTALWVSDCKPIPFTIGGKRNG